MKKALAVLFLISSASAQTVSNIRFDGIGDSSARIIFDVSSTYNLYRIRFGTSACTGGSGGTTQLNDSTTFYLYGQTAQVSGLAPSTLYHVCPEVSSNGGSTYSSGVEGTFTTTARGTTTPTAPETVSTTFPAPSGSTLNVASDCSDFQSKINSAVPGDTIIVPAGTQCTGTYTTPTAPDAFKMCPEGVVTSTSTIITYTLASTCGSSPTATAHGWSENQEVHFGTDGANSNCLPGNKIYVSLPSSGNNCDKSGGWNKNNKYYVHVVDATHVQILNAASGTSVIPGYIVFTANAATDQITYLPTENTPGGYVTVTGGNQVTANTSVQFYSTGTLPGGLSADTTYFLLSGCNPSGAANTACVTQVSATSGGSAINLTSAGTGTLYIVDQGTGTNYIAAAPTQSQQWITITTDGQLPPAGSRINSTWDSQLFLFLRDISDFSQTQQFQPGILAHNWRIVGALFASAQNTDYLTTTDPRSYCIGPSTNQDHRFISFDRVRIQGNSYPNRTGCRSSAANIFWDGGYMSIINSDLPNENYWHPWFGGSTGVNDGGMTAARASASQATFSAGEAHAGKCSVVTSGNVTINFTAGTATANPAAYVYLDMDCNFQVSATNASSTAGNCSVAGGTITPGGGTPTCTFTTSASPGFPTDMTTGRVGGLPLFTVQLSGGSIPVSGTSMQSRTPPGALPASEGTQFIIGGSGPGPYLFSNNSVSGSGLTVHFDDGGGPFLPRHDYTITNNSFTVDPATQLFGADSDGLWYGNRQPLEWKNGQRILVSGNTFQNCYTQVNPIGTCIIVQGRIGGSITDVDISNNQFYQTGGFTTTINPPARTPPFSKPGQRTRISNNLTLINGWNHYVPTEAQPAGRVLYGGDANEDIEISHNTLYNTRGSASQFIHWAWSPVGGMNIHDNFDFYIGDAVAIGSESTPNCVSTNKSLMDCLFAEYTSAPPSTPSYTSANNAFIPSWASSQNETGIVDFNTITTAFSGLTICGMVSCVPTQSTVADNISYVNWNCGDLSTCGATIKSDFSLNPASPYHNQGSDGTDIGVGFTTLTNALGWVGTVTVTGITTTAATVNIPAPSTYGCTVDYGTDPSIGPGTYTRAANAGGTQSQTVGLSGLAPATTYYYRVNCASEQPTGSFTTTSTPITGTKINGNIRISGGSSVR